MKAFVNPAVQAPALAIYARDPFPRHLGTPTQQQARRKWIDELWVPFQKQQRAEFEKEMRNARVWMLDGGNHGSFPLTHDRELVRLMREFLSGS